MHRKRFQNRQFSPRFSFSQTAAADDTQDIGVELGQRVRHLREESELSLRALAEQSGLSANTLSLIENGKSSPSVSTLQKIASAINVPLMAFFLSDTVKKTVNCTHQHQRKKFPFESGTLEDLGEGLSAGCVEPFVIRLDPNTTSGPDPIMHTGYEFVYCLIGRIAYIVETTRYILEPGDSLFFEAHLPHCWQNLHNGPSEKLLVLCPSDARDRSLERHFTPI
jgi:transcriptional regulator with XRE-family HTH domain